VYVEISIPLINQSFIGTGDLFTALILIWMNLTNNDLKKTMENTVATIQAVLQRTIKSKYQITVIAYLYLIKV
jgi:pyridoxine kinase